MPISDRNREKDCVDYLLEIECSPDLEESVQGRLFLTRSTGNVSRDGGITAYFESVGERDEAASLFPDARACERPRVNWLERYQQSLQPLLIGKSFVVSPDASLLPSGTTRHALIIPQEQAFGTGSHETTALCIELLETLDMQGKLGLDIGSGSGILALAMRRLGARKAIAFDNDLDTYAALRENRGRNAIDGMPLYIGTLDSLRGGAFDVITMNILPDVILPMLPAVRRFMRGSLIVSGILTTRRDDVLGASDLRVLRERTRGEWWAAILGV